MKKVLLLLAALSVVSFANGDNTFSNVGEKTMGEVHAQAKVKALEEELTFKIQLENPTEGTITTNNSHVMLNHGQVRNGKTLDEQEALKLGYVKEPKVDIVVIHSEGGDNRYPFKGKIKYGFGSGSEEELIDNGVAVKQGTFVDKNTNIYVSYNLKPENDVEIENNGEVRFILSSMLGTKKPNDKVYLPLSNDGQMSEPVTAYFTYEKTSGY